MEMSRSEWVSGIEEPAGAAEDLTGLLEPVAVALVKGAWGKFVTFDEVMAEMFFERLLVLAPELIEQFGPAIEAAPAEFIRLIDLSARALNPRTETIVKEGYRSAPSAEGARSSTRAECAAFFLAHDVTTAQWETAREAFLWTIRKLPHLDELEREDLGLGAASALSRFFVAAIIEPMAARAAAEAAVLSDAVVAEMAAAADTMMTRSREAGTAFYESLFRANPEVLRFFQTSDMDAQVHHLIAAVAFLARAAAKPSILRLELHNLAAVHVNHRIPVTAYPALGAPLMATIERFGGAMTQAGRRGWEILLDRVIRVISEPMYIQERRVALARDFLDQIAAELDWPRRKRDKRWSEVLGEIRATGTYVQTFEEIEFGARIAWRNAPKCVGRVSWRNLVVRDRRHVTEPRAIFEECVEHLRAANNGGNIDVVLTVFAPTRPGERWGPRIWNSQLIRFAGYRQADGTVMGDRANIALTAAIRRLGWTPPEHPTDFDVLPLVIDVPGHEPRLFEFDEADILRVPITHPTAPAIDALGLQWCAVPAISNFRLEIGGVDYGCLPFNGWFMGTEIARNLFEPKRYARALPIAEALGLDTSSESTIWRDRAFVELNAAIISSFQQARVTLVDHQTATRQFVIHDMRERRAGRECPAQWSWIVPPSAGSTTPAWAQEMRDFHLTPALRRSADRWAITDAVGCPERERAAARGEALLILFASETGTAETYARMAARSLGSLAPRVISMEAAGADVLQGASLVLVVSSTHRDGEVPSNGRALMRWLRKRADGDLAHMRFAVLGIGNRIYPRFCAAAQAFDTAFAAAGAERLAALTLADEIAGQAETVKQWIEMVSAVTGAALDGPAPAIRPRVDIVPAPSPRASIAGSATVMANRELLRGQEPGRSTRELILSLDPAEDGNVIAYRPGDHLALMPRNAASEIGRICAHLGLPPETWFRIARGGDDRFGAFREPYALEILLAEDLDLALPASPEELLRAMLAAAPDGPDALVLENWLGLLDLDSADPARRRHRDWMRDHFVTVADLLDNFPGRCPPLEVLIDILPRLRPRLYSIASTPRAHPGEPRILASNLRYTSAPGIEHEGVASQYIRHLAPGARVSVAVKPAHRPLPEDFAGPLLLIGAGTGLSLLYGILEDRAARGIAGAPVRLYFGCRADAEFLMRDQLLAWRDGGFLSGITVAFSRAAAAKAYVQDALSAEGREVLELLAHPEARVVVCGDARMAAQVADALLQILQRDAGLIYVEAARRLRAMRESGRYIEDVWGVQLNRDLAMAEAERECYDQGGGWLRRLSRKLVAARQASPAIRRY